MSVTEQNASVLYSDIINYSKVTKDSLKELLNAKVKEIRTGILTAYNHFYSNTWGDGLIVCSYSTIEIAKIALKIRDVFRYQDWKRLGFDGGISIRIALHSQQIKINKEMGKVIDVFGNGVDLASRIEPIVDPNQIFCTKKVFYQLIAVHNHNIDGLSIGKRKLAKNYGEIELYKLFWRGELNP